MTKLRQTAGLPMSKEDQDRYLQEMDQNLSKIDDVLQRDEQDQDEALRRKLEERKNRRRKLQDKLSAQEKTVGTEIKDLEERKQEIEAQALAAAQKAEDELALMKKQGEAQIEEEIENKKREKLEGFEDKLREAKNTKEFGRVLDNF